MTSAKPAPSVTTAASRREGAQGPLELLGRRREQLLLEAQLDGAAAGHGSALVLRGEPGIGKSALCGHAIRSAEGFEILRVRGHETEAEIAFLALADLLQPVLHHLEALPAPQQEVLSSVLGVGPSVSVDRHAICAATLGLIAAAARERPVLAVVDNAQWLDGPSADALAFAARRLDGERVAMLLAVTDPPTAGEEPAFDRTSIRGLRVPGLDPDAARLLLEATLVERPPPAVVERLLSATAGNPLALIEAPRALSEAQLRGTEPLPDPLPAGTAVQRAFERRLKDVPAATRIAVLVAASADSGEMGAISRALAALDLDTGALAPAEDAGLIEMDGAKLEFSHPLVRSAAYHAEAPGARRAAHAALAAVLDAEPERRAWHMAAAATEPTELVAGELEQVGLAAHARAGHASAARAFERAAELTPSAEKRAWRLLAAANDAQLAGSFDWAASCLRSALAATADPALRVEISHLWGAVERFRGAGNRGCELFLGAASEIEERDRDRAALLIAEAAGCHLPVGNVRAAERLLERARSLVNGHRNAAVMLVSGVGDVTALLGGGPPSSERLLSTVEELTRARDMPLSAFPLVVWMVRGLAWAERYDEARSLYERLIGEARETSRLGALSLLLLGLAGLEFRTGAWREATARCTEAGRLGAESSNAAVVPAGSALLAYIEAARGHEADCRRHMARTDELASEIDEGLVLLQAQQAHAMLDLGAGDPEAAALRLEKVARSAEARGLGHPCVVPFEPDLIESQWRSEQPREAEAALAVLERRAERSRSSWARAAALRCRGMLAPPGEIDEWFQRALAEHTRTPTPFDRARTELCYGERLRRERHRADARPHLRAALDVFEQLDAAPWAERARRELGATAEAPHRAEAELDLLTPQELAVAELVAGGATNREAAESLFVSPRTVEAHLRHIYRKLGLRSRAQLAGTLARRMKTS